MHDKMQEMLSHQDETDAFLAHTVALARSRQRNIVYSNIVLKKDPQQHFKVHSRH